MTVKSAHLKSNFVIRNENAAKSGNEKTSVGCEINRRIKMDRTLRTPKCV